MRISSDIHWTVVFLALLVALPFGFYNFVLDWHDKPFCHKQIFLALITWTMKNEPEVADGTRFFPNLGGVGRDSLAAIHREMADSMEWAPDYNYIPGLREDDPGDLVLLYFNRPTRWNMHVAPATIFTGRKWLLIPVDFIQGNRTLSEPGECSERVSEDEFKRRLKKTLDYLEANKRPNWQAAVAEQTKFLDSLTDSHRGDPAR